MTDISTVTNITGAEVSSETIGAIDIMNAFGYSYSCHHYLCYLIADSFLENVLLLQRWYKRRLFINSLNYRIHKTKYLKCMRDIFEYGMGYVALSRVKDLNALSIKSINWSKIKTHPKAIEFYKKIL